MKLTRNIIIAVVIIAVVALVYFYFVRDPSDSGTLVSVTGGTADTNTADTTNTSTLEAQEFLSLLLSVKSIKLDDSVFSTAAFSSLTDSSITLTQDGTEGRPNPFAPIGSDTIAAPLEPEQVNEEDLLEELEQSLDNFDINTDLEL